MLHSYSWSSHFINSRFSRELTVTTTSPNMLWAAALIKACPWWGRGCRGNFVIPLWQQDKNLLQFCHTLNAQSMVHKARLKISLWYAHKLEAAFSLYTLNWSSPSGHGCFFQLVFCTKGSPARSENLLMASRSRLSICSQVKINSFKGCIVKESA